MQKGKGKEAVIPAQAGIQGLQKLRDPCLRRDDGKWVFFDALLSGEGISETEAKLWL